MSARHLRALPPPEVDVPSEAAERLTEEATPRQVARAIAGMSAGMLRCRRLRQHNWEPASVEKERGRFIEVLVCTRCDSYKSFKYSAKGRVAERRPITYSEGYLLIGLGKIGEAGRDVINRTSLQADMELVRAKAKVKITQGKAKSSAAGRRA